MKDLRPRATLLVKSLIFLRGLLGPYDQDWAAQRLELFNVVIFHNDAVHKSSKTKPNGRVLQLPFCAQNSLLESATNLGQKLPDSTKMYNIIEFELFLIFLILESKKWSLKHIVSS